MKFVHTNIISENWKKLAGFYINVFECTPVLPERNLSGNWLDNGTGLKNASLTGIHLRLPGYGKNGPTLEIFQYNKMIKNEHLAANRKGFGHIAFHVKDVKSTLEKVILFRGQAVGDITIKEIEGLGTLTFIYITDPERNLIELQNWNYYEK
jgi:catechol 2,3-dioxygenase-like lactoylglutathione lyase family enzyme